MKNFLLADNGKAHACIVIPDSATPVEISAAFELHRDLKQITGAKLAVIREGALESGGEADKSVANTDITAEARERRLYVGATRAAAAAGVERGTGWPYDAIAMKTVGDALFLCGHPVRGALYAVYVFLEDVLGVRWWTDTESSYPVANTLAIGALDHFHAPKLEFREIFYRACFDGKFRSRLKLNFFTGAGYRGRRMENVPPELGGDHYFCRAGHGDIRHVYHTFYALIPPKIYFKDHPEWFSLINGKRTHERAQLCLTNREMEAELVRNALKCLREDPGADFIQISQNDHAGRCECPDCLAVEAEEGGAASGPMIRFVNRVAEAIEKEFPNVKVDTFAYTYTRKAPAKTRPRHNVTVRLCDIESDFARPLADSKFNISFMEDLAAWSRVAAGRLYIWDYVTNFSAYMLPHPNYDVLAPNVRTFIEYGAIGLFEQGDVYCDAGEFADYRNWLLSHLMWDPSRDAGELRREFLDGYYGQAGGKIGQYMELIAGSAAASPCRMHCYRDNTAAWIPTPVLAEACRLMEAALAEACAQDTAECCAHGYATRVRRQKLGIDYARILNWFDLHEHLGIATDANAQRRAKLAWIRDCRNFNVTAHREVRGGKVDIFDDHIDWFLDYERGLEEYHLNME